MKAMHKFELMCALIMVLVLALIMHTVKQGVTFGSRCAAQNGIVVNGVDRQVCVKKTSLVFWEA
jgi:hypothetical protein